MRKGKKLTKERKQERHKESKKGIKKEGI